MTGASERGAIAELVATAERIDLDHNATTRPDAAVVEAMLPWLREKHGNPSSAHALGDEAADAIRAARGAVARLLGARAAEIVLTSGGTESIATAIACGLASRPARARVVTTAVEHSATFDALEAHASRGIEVVRVPVDGEGRLDRGALASAIDERCALVSTIWANNETGAITALEGIADLCRSAGAAFHVDAVQAAGKVPIDVRAIGCDMASVSAHKMHGPKGTGALFVRAGFPYRALVPGSQEHARRGGTENVAGAVGFGRAAELARAFATDTRALEALRARRDRLERALIDAVPGARANAALAPRVPNTSNVTFPGLDAHALVLALSAQGLFVSAGSACHAAARAPSHVLLAMGRTREEASACVRFSLGRDTTDVQVERAAGIVTRTVRELLAPR